MGGSTTSPGVAAAAGAVEAARVAEFVTAFLAKWGNPERDGRGGRPSPMSRQPGRRSSKPKARSEYEQRGSFFTALDEHLALPFETEGLGVPVVVEQIDLAVSGEIVAI